MQGILLWCRLHAVHETQRERTSRHGAVAAACVRAESVRGVRDVAAKRMRTINMLQFGQSVALMQEVAVCKGGARRISMRSLKCGKASTFWRRKTRKSSACRSMLRHRDADVVASDVVRTDATNLRVYRRCWRKGLYINKFMMSCAKKANECHHSQGSPCHANSQLLQIPRPRLREHVLIVHVHQILCFTYD